MSAEDMLIWLETDYRSPIKTSTFGPYTFSSSDIQLLCEKLYEIGDEHPIHKLSREEIYNCGTLLRVNGLRCLDDKGNTYFTIFIKTEKNAEVATRLRTPAEHPTLTLYRVQMTTCWPDYKVEGEASLVDEIRKRLDPDGIRLLRDDPFQTYIRVEDAAARAKAFKGKGDGKGPMQLIDGVRAGGALTWDGRYISRIVVVSRYSVGERRRIHM